MKLKLSLSIEIFSCGFNNIEQYLSLFMIQRAHQRVTCGYSGNHVV
jgi:hypothetical protein